MAMAQPPDAADSSNAGPAVVDIEAGLRDCPVCMDPAEWVAIGPCGHREVCVNCAVRLRFFENDRRCCVCRAFCPTVVVTKQAAAASAAGWPPEGAGGAFPKPPLAAGGAGQVGVSLSYHDGMAAYFDDREQYERVTEMCLKPPAGLSHRRSPQDSPACLVIMFIINQVALTLIGCGTGVPIALHLFSHWYERTLVVLACGFLFGAAAYIFWKWTTPPDP